MVNKRQTNRREFLGIVQFPLTDSEGTKVSDDRRSGLDRRHIEHDRLAFKIIKKTNRYGFGL